MANLRLRIDTAVWTQWFRLRRWAAGRPGARYGALAVGHPGARAVLSRYEARDARRRAADPTDLHHFERSVHSQNGEDGILAEILRRVGEGRRRFIEIGASDGAENCTADLVAQGWSGTWVEGDHDKVVAARARVAGHPVEVAEAFVDRDSILPVLRDACAPADPDVLVIDVDGNDYWIWQVVATRHRARVVIIEYNAVVGPHLAWVMPYDPAHRWDETAWHGAGLAALARLGRSLGYELVGCDSKGVNAFFVLREEAHRFPSASVRDRWVPPRYSLPYGHPFRPVDEFDVPPIPVGPSAAVSVRVRSRLPAAVKSGQIVYVDVLVTNRTDEPVGCCGEYPVQLAYWWLDAAGSRVADEPVRCHQLWRADPHASCNLLGRVRVPNGAGTYSLVLGLVQEGNRWLDEGTAPAGTWTVAGN